MSEFPRHPRRAHWSIPTRPRPTAPTTRPIRPSSAPQADIDTRIRHLLPVLTATTDEGTNVTAPDQHASVRYLVDDVQAAIDFYTTHLGFTLNTSATPAFADVVRGPLRLLLRPRRLRHPRFTLTMPPPGAQPRPAGRRRPRRRDRPAHGAGLPFRSDLVSGPGGRQALLADPAGNLIELFQPAARPVAT